MKVNRLARVNSLIKEVLFEVIQKEVKNPHVDTFITVTRVDTSADLHHAKVYVSLIAPEEKKQEILKALQSAAGFIAVHASKKVKLRYFPSLLFKLDQSAEAHDNILKILDQLETERQNRPHDRDEG
jgi:ribosome-binding factor A